MGMVGELLCETGLDEGYALRWGHKHTLARPPLFLLEFQVWLRPIGVHLEENEVLSSRDRPSRNISFFVWRNDIFL